jgi:hypothetical protein
MTSDDREPPPGTVQPEPKTVEAGPTAVEPDPTTVGPDATTLTPLDPLAAQDRATRLAAYFAANRDRYTPDALRRAAREAGYTEPEIEAGLAAPAAAVAWTVPAAASGSGPKILPTIGTTVAFILGLWAVGAVLGSVMPDASLGLIAYIVAIVAATVGWRTLRHEHPSVARGLGCGVILAFVLPVVVVVAIVGFCIATNQSPFGA